MSILKSNQITFVDMTDQSHSCSISGLQTFKYNSSGTLQSDATITLYGNTEWVEIVQWQYFDYSTDTYKPYPTSSYNASIDAQTLTVHHTDNIFYNNVAKIKLITNDSNVYDVFSIFKLFDGEIGVPGNDSYSVILTNESQSIAVDANYIPLSASSYDCEVVVFKGVTQLSPTSNAQVGDGYYKITLPNNPSGMSLSQPTDGIVRVTTGTASINSSGEINLTIEIEGRVSVVKTFSYSVSKTGNDGTSGYTLQMNPQIIPLTCDKYGNLISTENINVVFGIYNGQNRVTTSNYTFNNLPDGVSINSFSHATALSDGQFQINISNPTLGVLFADEPNATIKINLATADGFVFERYITLVKIIPGNDGVPGDPGMTFTIYSTSGDTFTKNIDVIELETYAQTNGDEISDAYYLWYKEDEDGWVVIADDTPMITVHKNTVINVQSFKCVMTYHNVDYVAYYTVRDTTDIFTADIISLNGTVLDYNTQYLIVYTSVFKNGTEEVDILPYQIWNSSSTPTVSGIYYRVKNINNSYTISEEIYENGTWRNAAQTSPELLATFTGNGWTRTFTINSKPSSIGEVQINNSLTTSYQYNSSTGQITFNSAPSNRSTINIYSLPEQIELQTNAYAYQWYTINQNTGAIQNLNITGKVAIIPSSLINQTATLGCNVLDGDVVARAQIHIVDVNDTIVSNTQPSGTLNPGQVWLNTSVSPAKLYIYKGATEGWVAIEQDPSTNVFSSKPFNYRVNDLWIVGADYRPIGHSEGEILISLATNSTYDENDWVSTSFTDKMQDIITRTATIEQHLEIANDGMYIKAITDSSGMFKSYTHLDSDQLSFCSLTGSTPNVNADKIVWIGTNGMNTFNTTVEGILTIKGSSSTTNKSSKVATLQIGNFKLFEEPNGSLSLVHI